MGRSPCCSKQGLNRGAWTAMEDRLLTSYIQAHGEGRWRNLPHRAGLKRCGKSCRLRWLNYLRPNIKRGNITHDEEDLIIRLHNLLGNRWSLIAGRLPGRTDNEIKNYWNTTLAKKFRPSSPAIPLQNPPSEAKVRSQVIQTKASRCRNVVILEPQYPNLNSPPSDHTKFDEPHLAPQIQSPIQSPASHSSPKPHVHLDPEEEYGFQETHNSDVNLLTCGSNNRFQPNAADLCTDVFNLETSVAMDGHGIDQLMVNGWTTPSGFQADHNGTMDLDSLVLLLDSGDWP